MDESPTVLLPAVRDQAPPDKDRTILIPVAPKEPPVFVDASGRRRRWLRLAAYGAGLLGLSYTVLVGISFAIGPVGPQTVLPFVEPTDGGGEQSTFNEGELQPTSPPSGQPSGPSTRSAGQSAPSTRSAGQSAPSTRSAGRSGPATRSTTIRPPTSDPSAPATASPSAADALHWLSR